MNQLSIREYEEKIKQVIEDINTLRLAGDSGRKLDVLCEYKEYLEEELLILKNQNKS